MSAPPIPPLANPDEAYTAARFHPQGELAERARVFARRIVAAELRAHVERETVPAVWPDTFGNWSADQAAAASAMKVYLLDHLSKRAAELALGGDV